MIRAVLEMIKKQVNHKQRMLNLQAEEESLSKGFLLTFVLSLATVLFCIFWDGKL